MLRPLESGRAVVRENCVKSIRTKNARSTGCGTS